GEVTVQVGQDDARALVHQRLGCCPSDAAGGTGDEHDLAVQRSLRHAVSPSAGRPSEREHVTVLPPRRIGQCGVTAAIAAVAFPYRSQRPNSRSSAPSVTSTPKQPPISTLTTKREPESDTKCTW